MTPAYDRRNSSPWDCPACQASSCHPCVYTTVGIHREGGLGPYVSHQPGDPMQRTHSARPRVRCLRAGELALPSRCPACAALAGNCSCVPMPEEWRRLGYTGLFHTTARADAETRATWEAKGLPQLLPHTGWALAAFTDDGLAVLVREDACALVEAFTRPVQRHGRAEAHP